VRTVFFLLLLANVGFFAWTYVAERRVLDDAQLADRQVNEEAIRVLSPAQVAALVADRAKSVSRAPPKATVVACMELGSFSPADVARVQTALEPLALGSRLSQRREEEIATYWVYMPRQRSRQAANQKAAELRKLGIEDFFVVQEDPKFRYAISLGIFKTEEAARARLDSLRGKGVRTAQIGPRETPVQRVYFAVREVPEALASRLNELRLEFPGSELKPCPPAEKR